MPRRAPARGRRAGRAERAAHVARASQGRRSGGDGPRLLPRLCAARRAAADLRGAARARARAGQAGRHPHARGRRGHADAARRAIDGAVVLHCFSSPPLLDDALDHGWYVSFAGNVTYKNAYDLRDCRARRFPPTASSSRPTARISRRRPSAASETSRRSSRIPTTYFPSRAARDDLARSDRREREPRSSGSMRIIRARALGQHFLVDENILRRDRTARRAHADGRRAGDRARPRRADPVPRRTRRARARRRGRPAPRRAARADRANVSCIGAMRSTSTSAPSIRHRASSSRTCRTTSRRRSSPRASRSSSSTCGA